MNEAKERLERSVLNPLLKTTLTYRLILLALFAVVVWGLYAYSVQLRRGLAVTGMRDYISWGFYIATFVFFIGISHAGTLISAILRVSHAGWRTPVTRMAEFITVVALSIGALFPVIDLGRPDRVANVILFGRWQSPITWDILAISTYLTGSLIYLFLPMIEDMAICRDRISDKVHPLKRLLYRVLSLGWRGSPSQRKNLITGMGVMAILIIPIAVSVHTVVSFIFAMTLRAGWDSTVFGAYFVAGAIYSGIATIIIVMIILRKAFRLQEYLTDKHILNLGYMLGAFVLLMAYFNMLEVLVPGYKMKEEEKFLLNQLMAGDYWPMYWFYLLGGIVLPGVIILFPRTRNVAGLFVAAVLVNIGMFFERFLIVVPGMRTPLMPYEPASYMPTWVEWSILFGAFAAFALIIGIVAKLVPVISIWEVQEQMEEHQQHPVAEAKAAPPERVVAGLPAGSEWR